MKTINQILKEKANMDYSFSEEFNQIISDKCEGYDGKAKDKLKSFFNDLQHGGCISGLIGDFIYNSDNKAFYIKHIDDLEDFKTDLEDSLGERITDRNNLPHYTFVVWLCFEEYCYNIYTSIFEN
jgi:hypothetical protein